MGNTLTPDDQKRIDAYVRQKHEKLGAGFNCGLVAADATLEMIIGPDKPVHFSHIRHSRQRLGLAPAAGPSIGARPDVPIGKAGDVRKKMAQEMNLAKKWGKKRPAKKKPARRLPADKPPVIDPPAPSMTLEAACAALKPILPIVAVEMIVEEYRKATDAHPRFNSHHEGYAVLQEEVHELMLEVFKKPDARRRAALREEAVQVGAMALRFLVDLC